MERLFVGIITRDPARRSAFAAWLHAEQERGSGLGLLCDSESLMLASEGIDRCLLGEGRGAILGRLIPTDGYARGGRLSDGEAQAIVKSQGARLVEHYWGGYLAILVHAHGTVDLVRAPLGDLPCYMIEDEHALYVSSSPRRLAAISGKVIPIDWPALARQLGFAMMRTAETCLAGVSEIAGGDRITVDRGGVHRSSLWSPWQWTMQDRVIPDRDEAAVRLRDVAAACMADSVRGHRYILLKLSGGLDSSIVAACLARSGQPFSSLTLVTEDPSGDERDYARRVSNHLGAPLVEALRDPGRLDINRSPSRDLPRPSVPVFRQESDRLTAEVARQVGATIVVDGGGGDNVFCSLQSAAPVADCLLARGGWRRFGPSARSVAAIAHVSALEVCRRATGRALGRQRDHRWPVDLSFLSAEAIRQVPPTPDHAWLRAPPGTLPGRAAHVALIAAGQSYVEGLDPASQPALLAPLLAQPLVELCLRIPSWAWFDHGLNRAVARRAFSAELPTDILTRRSKGTPEAFIAQILESNRTTIRDRLLGGALARHGVIDTAALAGLLTSDRPVSDRYLHRIMTLHDAEVWAEGWAS